MMASKRDHGLLGDGSDDGVFMIKSKSPSKSAFQNKLASTKRSRASMPTARMLFTAMRTMDSQSLQPVGDLMYIVGTFWPFLSRVSTSSPSFEKTGVKPPAFSSALACSGSNQVPYFFVSSSEKNFCSSPKGSTRP